MILYNSYLSVRFPNLQITHKIARHYTWCYRKNCHIFREKVSTKYSLPEPYYARLESVMAITHFQTVVSSHFRSIKDDVLKIEL